VPHSICARLLCTHSCCILICDLLHSADSHFTGNHPLCLPPRYRAPHISPLWGCTPARRITPAARDARRLLTRSCLINAPDAASHRIGMTRANLARHAPAAAAALTHRARATSSSPHLKRLPPRGRAASAPCFLLLACAWRGESARGCALVAAGENSRLHLRCLYHHCLLQHIVECFHCAHLRYTSYGTCGALHLL